MAVSIRWPTLFGSQAFNRFAVPCDCKERELQIISQYRD